MLGLGLRLGINKTTPINGVITLADIFGSGASDYYQWAVPLTDTINAGSPVNNDPIDNIKEANGNKLDLVQVPGTARPLYKESGLNGLPYAEFDGVNDFIRDSALSITELKFVHNFSDDWVIFFVFRNNEASGSNKYFLGTCAQGTVQNGGVFYVNSGDKLITFFGDGSGMANMNFALSSTTINTGGAGWNWGMLSYKNSTNTCTGYLDGVIGNTNSPNTNPSTNQSSDFEVGRHPGVSNYTNIDIAEIVIAKGTNAEDNGVAGQIIQYINQQWGI